MSGHAETEFCRRIDCAQLGNSAVEREIEADETERAALATRFELVGIDNLSAKLKIRSTASGLVHLTGRLKAGVTQECVVSLEPVEATVEETFEQYYTQRPQNAFEEVLPLNDEEAPEPLENGMLDLGEAVAQQVALALDPYPKHPDAKFDSGDATEGDDDRVRPLAAIANLPLRR